MWFARDRIHADLSPFNILYWEGALTVIDFPLSPGG
ncbi:MAG: RIO1 family regulatory kinase/ATPase [Dehalococcoidia bacterium]